MTRIALVSTSDTDLLSARASGADYFYVNPSKAVHAEMAETFAAADLIVARILGSPKSLCTGFARIRGEGQPMVMLGGEQAPDASLMELSTVPIGVAADAHVYLAQGGPENLRQLHAFLSDTVLLTGEGFAPPVEQPAWGALRQAQGASGRGQDPAPRVGILFYRAQYTAGNTAYVEALADAVDAAGGVGIPIYATSLRDAPADLLDYLGTLDALVTTVLAAGGTRPATAERGGGRRGLGRTRPRRPGHPDPAGPLPDLGPRLVGGVGRGDDPAGRGHPGRGAGVRRSDHHGPLLLQGDRRRRAAGVRARPRTLPPGRGDRAQPRPPPPHPDGRTQDRDHAVGVPDQALPDRQRRWSGHPRLADPAAPGHAGRRL